MKLSKALFAAFAAMSLAQGIPNPATSVSETTDILIALIDLENQYPGYLKEVLETWLQQIAEQLNGIIPPSTSTSTINTSSTVNSTIPTTFRTTTRSCSGTYSSIVNFPTTPAVPIGSPSVVADETSTGSLLA
ncbi:uncharacterized protein PV09_09440 [Verruconis gallopava]|uniref:Uncharacterized protein n=1 Tax=Verruconis gallopava TaxID=253628 RepID=A0A0D2AIN1_9PEZI|nr:uncharacterized protein PV09_09440 [Verruconis gallopava]KIV98788.1 hypothetical protein PV09_09440 [Verruconis gallopava]